MSDLAPLKGADSPSIIPGSYIIVFKDDLSTEEFSENMKTVQEIFAEAGGDNKLVNTYNIGGSFRGFSGSMNAAVLEKIRSLPSVKYVECNQMAST